MDWRKISKKQGHQLSEESMLHDRDTWKIFKSFPHKVISQKTYIRTRQPPWNWQRQMTYYLDDFDRWLVYYTSIMIV